MLIDTHCHLDLMLPGFCADYLQNARACGVHKWLVPGVHPADWDKIAGLAGTTTGVYAAFGIHPGYATEVDAADLARLDQFVEQAAAIGEIGLDRRYGNLVQQESLFRQQIRLAVTARLPLLIHNVGMTGKILAILKEENAGAVGGIMHSFNGSVESAREFVRIGFLISPGTNLLRKGSKTAKTVKELGIDKLVLESDAEGTDTEAAKNQPDFILKLAEHMADITNQPVRNIIDASSNAVLQVVMKMAD